MIQNRSFRHKETFNVVFVIPSWWYFLMRYDILWTHEKRRKKMSFAFYLERYYFDKTRNLSFAKKNTKFTTNTMEKTRIPHTHTQSHANHLDIERHYHRAFNFFWFFLFIYEIWFAWADIWETIEKVRYDFAIDFGKTIVVCLKVNAHFKSSQPTIQLEHINSDQVEVRCTGMLAIECSPAPINFA